MARSKLAHLIGCAGLLALLFMGLPAAPNMVAAQDVQPLTREYRADIAQDWMQLLYDRIWAEGVGAPQASRLYGYAGVALYEAVLGGMPGNNDLAGQIRHMPDLPLWDANKVYDWPLVANETLATIYHNNFFEFGSAETHDAIDALHAEWLEARSEVVSEAIVNRSVAYGQELAEALGDWILDDGYTEIINREYELPVGGGRQWVPTTPGTTPNAPYWGQLRPFGLDWADECAVPLNIEYSEDPDSAFYAQALEVKEIGDDLTREQREIAQWWVDTPGVSGTPAGHWVMIENQLVDQLGLELHRAAEMYAMTGIALADSFISCWSLKYQVNLVRPVTYIQQHIRRSWAPLIETPPFPEYPSGHSVVSAAAADILTSLFGAVAFTDETSVRFGIAPRSFTTFEAAAMEAAYSRILGGIHFRTAVENGMRQGRCIAEHLLDNIQLNPITQGGE